MTTTDITPLASAKRPPMKVSMLKPTTVAPSVGFGRLVHVELRKFLDTRAGAWLLGLSLVGTLGLATLCTVFFRQLSNVLETTSWMPASNIIGLAMSFLVPPMVILLFTTEWTQRTTLATFSLEPRRGRVIAAKGVVAAIIAITLWLVQYLLTAATAGIGGAIGNVDVDWSTDWKVLLGMLAAHLLTMAMAAGFAMLFMNTAAAIVLYMALPMVTTMLSVAGAKVQAILRWVDLGDASLPLTTGKWEGNDVWQFLTAVTLWVLIPVAVGAWRQLTTEAK